MSQLRDNLNKHLTNNVVLRIDYVPIPDELVDIINGKIANYLLVDSGIFDDSTQTFMRNIDIQVNDPSIQDFNEYINVREKSKIKSYEYYKNDVNTINEMKIVFNRQFCSIDVNQIIKYYKYEQYRDIFIELLKIFEEHKLIINRFGLRKLNDFFLKKDSSIDEYVKNKYFNFECDDLLSNSDSFISEKRYTFADSNYKVNLITHSSLGMMENDFVKRIAFDIDVYVDDVKKLLVLLSTDREKFINAANDCLFDIYIKLLNDKMINLLKNDAELDDDNIIYGVDYNE